MQLAQAVVTQQSAGLLLHTSGSNLPATATTKTVTTPDAGQPKQKCKEADLNLTMRPSANSTSVRNLYPIEWCKENKGSSHDQYAVVWDAMKANKDPRIVEYERHSATIKAARKSAGSGSMPISNAPDPEDDANEE
ncbi:hypothetical protein JVT61DRAFT_5 [Boletus reticuloceps]|uniref:Uncharacterized protein n=1 Tax=Boletus reticuloceps TaxID=495285 RepID=A0A8I2Z2Y7_9AGAM|nr:hypothetical protein JVT61DRAFT_5 [Boletus reticuloceps]